GRQYTWPSAQVVGRRCWPIPDGLARSACQGAGGNLVGDKALQPPAKQNGADRIHLFSATGNRNNTAFGLTTAKIHRQSARRERRLQHAPLRIEEMPEHFADTA